MESIPANLHENISGCKQFYSLSKVAGILQFEDVAGSTGQTLNAIAHLVSKMPWLLSCPHENAPSGLVSMEVLLLLVLQGKYLKKGFLEARDSIITLIKEKLAENPWPFEAADWSTPDNPASLDFFGKYPTTKSAKPYGTDAGTQTDPESSPNKIPNALDKTVRQLPAGIMQFPEVVQQAIKGNQPIGNPMFKCGNCSAIFLSSRAIEEHMKQHVKPEPDIKYAIKNASAQKKPSPVQKNSKAVQNKTTAVQKKSAAAQSKPRAVRKKPVSVRKNPAPVQSEAVTTTDPSNASVTMGLGDLIFVDDTPFNVVPNYQMNEASNEIPPVPGASQVSQGLMPMEFAEVVSETALNPAEFILPHKNESSMTTGQSEQLVTPTKNQMSDTQLTQLSPINLQEETTPLGPDMTPLKEIFKCGICETIYTEKHMIEEHMRKHVEAMMKPCKLKKCQQKFMTDAQLTEHLKEHEKQLVCIDCGKTFASRYSWVTHTTRKSCQKKVSEDPHDCHLCGMQFPANRKGQLSRHIAIVHSKLTPQSKDKRPKIHICDQCGVGFGTKGRLRVHVSNKHYDGPPVICHFCNKEYKHMNSLRTHQRHAHPMECKDVKLTEGSVHCTKCYKIFSSESWLKSHQSSGLCKKYTCSKCGLKFTSVTKYHAHEERHAKGTQGTEDGIAIICKHCGKEFYCESALRKHEASHLLLKPHACPVCSLRFSKIQSLAAHTEKYHNTTLVTGSHKCNKCGKMLPTPHGLRLHMQRHFPSRIYSCTECGLGFKHNMTLISHMNRQHLGKFGCHVCKARFYTNQLKQDHIRQNHPNDMFACTICTKVLVSKAHLVRHMEQVHSGTEKKVVEKTKRYVCGQCAQEFNSESLLEEHLLSHATTLHHCSYCDQTFTDESLLAQHERIHTTLQAYQCEICDQAFSLSYSLDEHMETHRANQLMAGHEYNPE